MLTDAWGNNPIQGKYDISWSDGVTSRSLSLSEEELGLYQNSINANNRITQADPAYEIVGNVASFPVLKKIALMDPMYGVTLAQLAAKSTDHELVQVDGMWVFRCTYQDYHYSITIDPTRNYMISRLDAEHSKGGDSHSHGVRLWTEVNGYHLPQEIEDKSSRKVGNRVLEYTNWSLGDARNAPLELKFLNGSKVHGDKQIHIWGDKDQPIVSFNQNDAASLALFEKNTLSEFGPSRSGARAAKIAVIIAIAALLLGVGYFFLRKSPKTLASV